MNILLMNSFESKWASHVTIILILIYKNVIRTLSDVLVYRQRSNLHFKIEGIISLYNLYFIKKQ